MEFIELTQIKTLPSSITGMESSIVGKISISSDSIISFEESKELLLPKEIDNPLDERPTKIILSTGMSFIVAESYEYIRLTIALKKPTSEKSDIAEKFLNLNVYDTNNHSISKILIPKSWFIYAETADLFLIDLKPVTLNRVVYSDKLSFNEKNITIYVSDSLDTIYNQIQ